MRSNISRIHSVVDSGADLVKPKTVALIAAVLMFSSFEASASFETFSGDLPEEANWRAAVGTYSLESFEAYADGAQISSLPNLGISFDELSGGGHPQAYWFGTTPYGPTHLANFPYGIGGPNQWNDIVLRVLPGYTVTALGYWNGDGQRDTMVARAYDTSGNFLGSVGAFSDTFAGFISSVPIGSVVFDGNTGDGWNHIDGLQTGAVPEPNAVWLLLLGIGTLRLSQRRPSSPSTLATLRHHDDAPLQGLNPVSRAPRA